PVERSRDGWWPAALGSPSNSGSQNGIRYAFFPLAQRLVIERDGSLEQYETGGHRIEGIAQKNDEGLAFMSQHGELCLSALRKAT
ncbi:MAG: hypothetical protein EON54_20320, partial [Alcaligenaceae bacterium]